MREILFRGQTRRLGEKVWMNGEKVPSSGFNLSDILEVIGNIHDNPELLKGGE